MYRYGREADNEPL